MLAILLSSLQPTPHLHLSADKYVCYLASHVALWVLLIGSGPHVLSTVGFIRRLREKNSKETDMDRKSHTIFFTSDQPITRSWVWIRQDEMTFASATTWAWGSRCFRGRTNYIGSFVI
jgi:hypothetical protein